MQKPTLLSVCVHVCVSKAWEACDCLETNARGGETVLGALALMTKIHSSDVLLPFCCCCYLLP